MGARSFARQAVTGVTKDPGVCRASVRSVYKLLRLEHLLDQLPSFRSYVYIDEISGQPEERPCSRRGYPGLSQLAGRTPLQRLSNERRAKRLVQPNQLSKDLSGSLQPVQQLVQRSRNHAIWQLYGYIISRCAWERLKKSFY